jgi:DNA-binding MarR family transcriptional regulator
MTFEELEDVTLRQPHSILTLVNRMVDTGLLHKEKNPNEKKYLISITPEIQGLFNKITSVSLEMTLDVLSTRERRSLALSLNRLLIKARHY